MNKGPEEEGGELVFHNFMSQKALSIDLVRASSILRRHFTSL